MFIDKTKSGLQNVIDLINTANNTTLVENAGVGFSAPVEYAGPSGHNTKMTLTGDPDFSYEGVQDVYYTRIGLDDNVAMPPVNYPITRSVSASQFMDQVVAALNLVESEVQPLGAITPNAPSVTLTPIANSLLYVGSLNLALKWPVGQPFTFLLDTFTGSGALSAHTSDDGTHWWGVYGDPTAAVEGQLSGGQLAQTASSIWAYADKTIPSEHTTEFKFTINPGVVSSDLEISTGSGRYRYNVYLEISNDGKIYWQLNRRDIANQSQIGNFNWVLGPQTVQIVVLHDKTELWFNGVLLATIATLRYVDTNIIYFHMDNGSAPASVKIDSIEVMSNDPMEEAPLNLWYVSAESTGRVGTNTHLVLGDNIWICGGRWLRSYNCETGALVSSFDFDTYFGITGSNYQISCVDVQNGYIWLENTAGSDPNVPSIVRVNPAANGGLGAILDGLFASTNATTSYWSLVAGHAADGVWACRSNGATKEIVNLHPTTGAVITATAVTNPLQYGIDELLFDGYGSRLMLTETGTSSIRTRFFKTSTKTFEATVYNDRGGLRGGNGVVTTAGVYHLNFNNATGNYRWTRYSSGDMSILNDVDIVHPELPPNDGDVWLHGPVREFKDLNEIMVLVERYDVPTDSYPKELWAFDSDTLAFRRKVIAHAPNRRVYDYALDFYGNLYLEFLLDGSPRTTKLARSYRT